MEKKGTPASGNRTGQKGFTGSGRAHQQHALGDSGPQVVVLVGGLEEPDDFLQLRLFLVRPGHILKGDLSPLALGLQLGLAEAHHIAAASGLAHHEVPQRRHGPYQQDGG